MDVAPGEAEGLPLANVGAALTGVAFLGKAIKEPRARVGSAVVGPVAVRVALRVPGAEAVGPEAGPAIRGAGVSVQGTGEIHRPSKELGFLGKELERSKGHDDGSWMLLQGRLRGCHRPMSGQL